MFTSFTKRENRTFHVLGVQRRQRNVQKCVIHVKSCCFRGAQRQFSENICSEDDLRSRILGTFVVKFLACLTFVGF